MDLFNAAPEAAPLPARPGAESACGGCAWLETDAPVVTLLSGATVCTSCPAWREECGDRAKDVHRVLALSCREDRQTYLDAYGQERGQEALERLKAGVIQTWELRRAARAAETLPGGVAA